MGGSGGSGGAAGGNGPEQGLDEDVVVSADAGTVAGLGPQEALDELEEDADEDRATGAG